MLVILAVSFLDDVVGRQLVLGGSFRRVQFVWVVERLWRPGLFLAFCVRR